jgi:hypothetical protein
VRNCGPAELGDTDLRFVRPKERAQAFENDLVVVHERDTNRLGHAPKDPSGREN